MDKELLEQMKTNEKPFGLMSKELHGAFKSLPKDAKVRAYNVKGWSDYDGSSEWDYSCVGVAFQLHPDYQPDPEIVECEIYEANGCWNYKYDLSIRSAHVAHNHTNFIGFRICDDIIPSFEPAYRHKVHNDGLVDRIPFDSVHEYEVVWPTHVLFRKESE